MKKQYPIQFTLDNGTAVEVNKTGENTLGFKLKPQNGPERDFTYVNDERYTEKVEDGLDFDQLNALRKYWLEVEDMD